MSSTPSRVTHYQLEPEAFDLKSGNRPLPFSPVENGEIGEAGAIPVIDWGGTSPNSSNSSGGKTWRQPAIFPPDSVLASWMTYAREQVEGADSYIIGSILPACAAMLGRRVWFPWGDDRKFPNVFSLLAGKPGDRKSSTIKLAAALARRLMPSGSFLPSNFSPEAMFDEFNTHPDKIYIVDEGNTVLTDWQKGTNGERVAARFLELYDCKGMSESFRRNKGGDEGEPQRTIEETSTSVLMGATFNVAAFQGQVVRAGMARRFLYYVADGHGRMIGIPKKNDGGLGRLAEMFKPFTEASGPMEFTPEAEALWQNLQVDNRARIEAADPLAEAAISRLGSSPMQTLGIAMIFQLARWALSKTASRHRIEADTLMLAGQHVEECLAAAEFLDSISHRAEIAEEGEIMLAKIRHEHRAAARAGSIFLTRSDITRMFCHNTGRRGSLQTNDIYLRIIPELERKGLAKLIRKEPSELYAFRVEEQP